MRLDITDEAFRREGATWLQSLDAATITDLEAVFRISPGYYPTTLIELWRVELSRRGLREVTHSIASPVPEYAPPVCHPGDCEWRFTSETAAMLLERVTGALAAGARIAHVGTPTTFMLGRRQYRCFRHFLLDRNASGVGALSDEGSAYRIDLIREAPPVLDAEAGIVDPPWYPTDTRAFLLATSRTCVVGARIILCQPTRATRPGVTEERAALMDELPRLGFACHGIDTAQVRYTMPRFEANSLKAAEPDLVVPDDWRTGDLLTLEKLREAIPQCSLAAVTECWHEVAFGPVRIKLRQTRGPDIGTLVPGDILRTVSRRDPIRQHIGMWTSSNRVYTVEHPHRIGGLIDLCHADLMRSQFTLSRTLNHAQSLGACRSVARRLFDSLLIELQEHVLESGRNQL